MKLEIFLDQKPWALETSMYIALTDHNGKRFICEPMQMKFSPLEEAKQTEPTLVFSNQASVDLLPALSQALAKAGFKPLDSDAGELKATKVHLEDMRELVKGAFLPPK